MIVPDISWKRFCYVERGKGASGSSGAIGQVPDGQIKGGVTSRSLVLGRASESSGEGDAPWGLEPPSA